jgi:hypothetical protein
MMVWLPAPYVHDGSNITLAVSLFLIREVMRRALRYKTAPCGRVYVEVMLDFFES